MDVIAIVNYRSGLFYTAGLFAKILPSALDLRSNQPIKDIYE